MHTRSEQSSARLNGSEDSIECGRIEQHVSRLRDVGGVQRVVERVVAHVMFLESDGEGEESARWDLQRAQQLPGRERGVGDSSEGSSTRQVADAEDVYAPPIDFSELTSQFFFMRSVYSVSWHTFTGEAVGVRQCSLDARDLYNKIFKLVYEILIYKQNKIFRSSY